MSRSVVATAATLPGRLVIRTTTPGNEDRQFPPAGPGNSMTAQPARNDVPSIVQQLQFGGLPPTKRPQVEALPAEVPPSLCMRRLSTWAAKIDVVVIANNVDVPMVDDDVLPVPYVGIAPDHKAMSCQSAR